MIIGLYVIFAIVAAFTSKIIFGVFNKADVEPEQMPISPATVRKMHPVLASLTDAQLHQYTFNLTRFKELESLIVANSHTGEELLEYCQIGLVNPSYQTDVFRSHCADPACIPRDYSWDIARDEYYNLLNSGAPHEQLSAYQTDTMCPLTEAINAECSTDHIVKKYRPDPYFAQCERGADCPTVPDRWNELVSAVDATNFSDATIPHIRDMCDYTTEMDRCGYDYSADTVYRDWCGVGDECLTDYAALLKEQKDFEWRAKQGIDERTRYQIVTERICPLHRKIIDNCPEDKRQWILDNPYWKQYCENPGCAAARQTLAQRRFDLQNLVSQNVDQDAVYQTMLSEVCPAFDAVVSGCSDPGNITEDAYYQQYCVDRACTERKHHLYKTQKDFDWRVEQGISENVKLQYLERDLCPAIQQALDEPGCSDAYKTNVKNNFYYKQYCADTACIRPRIALQDAETTFFNQVSQDPDPDALYQLAFSKLCPAYDAILSQCTSQAQRDRVLNSAQYKKYCANRECAEKQHTMYNVLKEYNWQLSQGADERRQWQLGFDLCPAFDAVAACDTTVLEDARYKKYCSDSKCAHAQFSAYEKNRDYLYQSASGLNEDGRYQLLLNAVCPAFQTVVDTCPDADGTRMKTNPLWNTYCADAECTRSNYELNRKLSDYTTEMTASGTAATQYQLLLGSVCPAFENARTECDREPDHPLWTAYCANQDCTRAQYDIYKALSGGIDSVDEGGIHHELINRVCPAFDATTKTCDAETLKQYNNNKYFQMCQQGTECLVGRDELRKAQQLWQPDADKNTKYRLATTYMCPAFDSILSNCEQNDDIRDDPIYQQYCANPGCARAAFDISQLATTFNNHVTGGMNVDGQYQMLIDQVCPVFTAGVEQCPDRSAEFQADPLWTQWCNFGTQCLSDRHELHLALANLKNVRSSNPPEYAVVDTVLQNVCPVFKDVLLECGADAAMQNYVLGHPDYIKYCKYEECTGATKDIQRAKTTYAAEIQRGATMDAQYQYLLNSVCPAFQTAIDSACPDTTVASLKVDPIWAQWCSLGTQCLTDMHKLNRAETDLDWNASQGLNADGQLHALSTSVCPAYTSLESSCPVETVTNWKAQSPWYQNGCRSLKCAQTKQTYLNALNYYNTNRSKLNASGIAQTIANMCPIFDQISADCDVETAAQINSGTLYDQCAGGAVCPMLRYNRDDQYRQLQNYGNFYTVNTNYANTYNAYCSYANRVLNECGDYDAPYRSTTEYQQWCSNPTYRDRVMTLNHKIKTLEYTFSRASVTDRLSLSASQVAPLIRQLHTEHGAEKMIEYIKNQTLLWWPFHIYNCPLVIEGLTPVDIAGTWTDSANVRHTIVQTGLSFTVSSGRNGYIVGDSQIVAFMDNSKYVATVSNNNRLTWQTGETWTRV